MASGCGSGDIRSLAQAKVAFIATLDAPREVATAPFEAHRDLKGWSGGRLSGHKGLGDGGKWDSRGPAVTLAHVAFPNTGAGEIPCRPGRLGRMPLMNADASFLRDVAQLLRFGHAFTFVLAEFENAKQLDCSVPDADLACRRFAVAALSANPAWRSAGTLTELHAAMVFDEQPTELSVTPSDAMRTVASLHTPAKSFVVNIRTVAVRSSGFELPDLLAAAAQRMAQVSEANHSYVTKLRDPLRWCPVDPLSIG